MAVNTAPGTAAARAGDRGERVAPDQLHQAGGRDRRPARHAEPGGGDVDVEDAHALALERSAGARNRPQASAPAISAPPDQPSQAVSGRAILRKRAGFA